MDGRTSFFYVIENGLGSSDSQQTLIQATPDCQLWCFGALVLLRFVDWLVTMRILQQEFLMVVVTIGVIAAPVVYLNYISTSWKAGPSNTMLYLYVPTSFGVLTKEKSSFSQNRLGNADSSFFRLPTKATSASRASIRATATRSRNWHRRCAPARRGHSVKS
jgi:hypothetical protein